MRPAAQIALPLDPAGAPPVRLESVRAASGVQTRVHPAGSTPTALIRDWADLAEAASEPNSFAEAWFITASLATLAQKREIRLIEARREDVLIGVIPLSIETHYGRLPVRFVQNWCHHQLFLGTPLVRRGEETAFWSALLERLDDAAWAPNFLHLRGLVEDGPVHRGLAAAAALRGRGCAKVHHESRAMLESGLEPDAYYRAAVRPKKRKEIRRLQNRLAELGVVRARRLEADEPLEPWCDAFLALERTGWKGKKGTALACDPNTELFFRGAVAGARAAGRLEFLRLDLDGRPIAMLANFLAPPGSFSFKTCFDDAFARFSPGVLIQLENLAILDRRDIDWMDSCAAAGHPMIDSLWRERRSVVRVTVPLRGARRLMVFAGCRALESGSAALRRLAGRSRP
jgi:CelD/BcsL family acetyltransferase involved in cellulose biosynthesis